MLRLPRSTGNASFSVSFNSTKKPNSVIIEIAVDDQYTLRINDRYVATWTDVHEMKRFDVTPIIEKGENTVYVSCRNNGGPAGFLARMEVVQADGEKRSIVTDRHWRAQIATSGNLGSFDSSSDTMARSFRIGAARHGSLVEHRKGLHNDRKRQAYCEIRWSV